MADSDIAAIQSRLEDSPTLRQLHQQLSQEVGFCADPSATFDPILIISVISLAIQLIRWCREKQDDATIRARMRDLRALPPRQMLRLRRKLNDLWRAQPGVTLLDRNPLLAAAFTLSDTASDEALDELLWLAERGTDKAA